MMDQYIFQNAGRVVKLQNAAAARFVPGFACLRVRSSEPIISIEPWPL